MPDGAAAGPDPRRLRLELRGAVQGVGFRPFVYRLAGELGLAGWVANGPAGVTIEVEGPAARLETFAGRLRTGTPPPGAIHGLEPTWLDATGLDAFRIRPSLPAGAARAVVLPDIAPCAACRDEVFDPAARRHGYPFTNCSHCGPRFTIIDALPYDRARTAMAGFPMCRRCRHEYGDPADRRFHAQPIACPDCGPQLAWWDAAGRPRAARADALAAAIDALTAGGIVAVKGLGGFQLLVDAADADAVRRLRRAKARDEKPFAVMFTDLAAARRACEIPAGPADLLAGPEAPIVLLPRRFGGGSTVADDVAPGHPLLGAMLPSTPLHHLLLAGVGRPLVATSGNLAEEPICIDEADAVTRLGGVADAFLVHDRPIRRHADDSVVRWVAGRQLVLRRGRGYAPYPLAVPGARPARAVGGQSKNAAAVAVDGQAILGQHVGDLEHAAARSVAEDAVDDLARLYGVDPAAPWVCDLHPDYAATRCARRRAAEAGARTVAVQHHHAHVRACMAENQLQPPVLGVAWDGTGWGPDGSIWGGEFLHVSPGGGARRVAHLRPFRLPGAEAAVRAPGRAALGLLHAAGGPPAWTPDLAPVAAHSPQQRRIFARLLDGGLRAPWTSSAGRLLDAFAALAGVRQVSAYEGQTAMAFEIAAATAPEAAAPGAEGAGAEGAGPYPFPVRPGDRGADPFILDWGPALEALLADLRAGAPVARLAWRTHAGLAAAIVDTALRVEAEAVALTGGCFQNALLTELTVDGLRAAGLRPYWHQRIPPNDGGLALGQLAVAAAERELAAGADPDPDPLPALRS